MSALAALVLLVILTSIARALIKPGPRPTLGFAAVAWGAGWGVWTADLIDTIEACSSGGGGGSAVKRPQKRYT